MGHGGGSDILIKDALVFLFAAGLIVPFLRLARIPAVMGFILAGIALGPFGFGALAEDHHWLEYLTVNQPEAAAPFAELGVLFLLFLLGLELSFEKLWALRRTVFGAGSVQVGLSALALGLIAYSLGQPASTAALIGLALALSSTAIVMQLLVDQRRSATPVGRASLGVLLFQDILVAPILIFAGFMASSGDKSLTSTIVDALWQGLAAVVVIFLIGRFALRRLFHVAATTGGRDFLMALTLLTVVGAAVITASAGLSLALGAFLAGLLLGETEFKHQTEVDLEPFKGLLLGLFFMTVGMSLDLTAVIAQWSLILSALGVLLLLKYTIALLAVRLFSGSTATAIETASLLGPSGEFAFVILGAGLASGLIDTTTNSILASTVGLSMMLTPLLWRLGHLASSRMKSAATGPAVPGDYTELEGHVILIGFGRVGRAIAGILRAEETEFVALERNAANVRRARQNGWQVYFGDAAREEIFVKAGGRGASMMIVTVDDAESAEAMVRVARKVRPVMPIIARARDAEHAKDLQRAGANFVVPDAIEAGLQLAAHTLEQFGHDAEVVRTRIASERDQEYRKASVD